MLTDGLTRAIALIRKRKFLMVGRRWSVNLTEPWDFPDLNWRTKLLAFHPGIPGGRFLRKPRVH
jgi:hypothetical protein